MGEVMDRGELKRQLARSEEERRAAIAHVASLEAQLQMLTAETHGVHLALTDSQRRLTEVTALHSVQTILAVRQATASIRSLVQGPWWRQLWRRLRGRAALAQLCRTVEAVEEPTMREEGSISSPHDSARHWLWQLRKKQDNRRKIVRLH